MGNTIHPDIPLTIQDILLVVISLAGAWTDYKHRKIYDRMTWSTMAIALVIGGVTASWAGAKQAGLGILIGFAVFVIPCELGAIGGGDAKFMMAVGALEGYIFMIMATLFGFAFGAFQALYLIARRENGIKDFIKSLTTGSIFCTSYEDRSTDENVPLGVYLAIGNILTLLCRHYKVVW